MKKLKVSVVIPVYNEETVIPELSRRLQAVLASLPPQYDHDIIFVDDGSIDRSFAMLKALCYSDASIRVIRLSRNFGHQFAMTAGLDHADGDAVVTMDGDLQDPPELIPELLKKWQEGYEVVYGVRQKRSGESPFKLLTAKLFYRTIRKLSDTTLPLDAGDFRLMDRRVLKVLAGIREQNRYLRGLVSWAGFSQTGLPYERDKRYAGTTKYSFGKMVRFAFDGILSFSDRPLKIASVLGTLITVAAFIFALVIFISKLVSPALVISGWTSLILTVLFLGGVQLLSLGILGLYIGRQYREVKARPLYVVAETASLEATASMQDGEDR